MKNRFLVVLLATVGLVSLAGCNGNNKVLADAEHEYHLAGGHEVKKEGEWVANEWNQTVDNNMTAASIADVTKLNKTLGKELGKKDVKFLYTGEIRMGVTSAEWTTYAIKDGKKVIADGSYTVKVIMGTYDTEDETYINDQWVPDPHSARAESLTNDTLFMPTWTEAKDDNGFSWADNPVCIGGAGIYTVVIAKYDVVSSADAAGWGLGLIRKEAIESELGYIEYVAPTEDTWGFIGTPTEWEETADKALTKDEDGKYRATVTLAVNDEFKLRANSAWDTSVSGTGFTTTATANFDLTGDNAKALVAGDYLIVLDPETNTATIEPSVYGVVGTVNEWGATPDITMTNAEGVWTATVELAANAEIKVRADGRWDVSYGTETGGNIVVEAAGNYVVTFTAATKAVTVTPATAA